MNNYPDREMVVIWQDVTCNEPRKNNKATMQEGKESKGTNKRAHRRCSENIQYSYKEEFQSYTKDTEKNKKKK
jgi:hypothetical protein